MLKLRLVGSAQGIAHGKRHEESPGRSHFLRHFTQERKAYGGDATLLDDAGDQSHGLVAHRSDGHQEYGVYLILPQLRCDLRSGLRD